MIVKHENRIRALEAKQVNSDGGTTVDATPTAPTVPAPTPSNNSGPDEMAPDEV